MQSQAVSAPMRVVLTRRAAHVALDAVEPPEITLRWIFGHEERISDLMLLFDT